MVAYNADSVSRSRFSRLLMYATGSPRFPPSWYLQINEDTRHWEHEGLQGVSKSQDEVTRRDLHVPVAPAFLRPTVVARDRVESLGH